MRKEKFSSYSGLLSRVYRPGTLISRVEEFCLTIDEGGQAVIDLHDMPVAQFRMCVHKVANTMLTRFTTKLIDEGVWIYRYQN